MISAHDFFHILRSFDLVTEIEELVQVIIELGEYLEDPLEDVLS